MRELFVTFLKIGLFTIGGGYAMIPLIETEVTEKRRWLTKEEFLDVLAIAQSCPGVFAINMSIFIGYRHLKTRGAIASCLGTAFPSFVIILAIAMFFSRFKDNAVVAAIFRGIRPAVVAMIVAPVFGMARNAKIMLSNCWIPVAAALLIWLLGVSPVYIIVIAGVAGYVYGQYIKPTE